jgi:LPXTG-motif cell wall-anchored protein
VQKQKEMRMMKPLSVAFQAWLFVMIPVVAQAGHHPAHGAMEPATGEPALWIILGIIAFVVIMVLVGRTRKKRK